MGNTESPAKQKQKHHEFDISRYDDEFDEVWIKGANVHIERMDETAFWIGIDPPPSSGLPRIMLNTGVCKGEWYFNLEEDCLDGAQSVSVRRPRSSRRPLPKGPRVTPTAASSPTISPEGTKENEGVTR